MAELIVVSGPPGAGKSTVADLLVRDHAPSVLVAGDHFFAFLRGGYVAPWLPAADAQNTVVTRAAAAAVGQFLAGGHTVVYDGVVRPALIGEFAAHAAPGERVHYAVLLPSLESCTDRVRRRAGHGFTDLAATAHMWHEFAGPGAGAGAHLVPVSDGDDPETVAATVRAGVAAGRLALAAAAGDGPAGRPASTG